MMRPVALALSVLFGFLPVAASERGPFQVGEHLERLLLGWGVQGQTTGWMGEAIAVAFILLVAYAADYVCRRFVVRAVLRVARHTKAEWDDVVLNQRVLNRFCHLVPPVIIYLFVPFALGAYPRVLGLVLRVCLVYMLVVGLRSVSAFLAVLYEYGSSREAYRDRPLKGVYQIVQVALAFVGFILVVSVLINRSPLHLLAGLGASAAILMLVFKDTIVGFVSGIQLSANDMLRPGDWITMEKYGADGTVIDVTLNTVKVRNWDNTITTIPPYALVSDSFQNWRGMRDSGGRRIKRAVFVDMNSVGFCTPEMLARFRRIHLLADYIAETEQRVRQYNEAKEVTPADSPANGLRQTNLGVFRAYLQRYIEQLPSTNTELTCLVRQLAPTEKGIPMEVYFFCRNKDWIAYEQVQSDVFDHILAVIPEFGLRVFQAPSGADFRPSC